MAYPTYRQDFETGYPPGTLASVCPELVDQDGVMAIDLTAGNAFTGTHSLKNATLTGTHNIYSNVIDSLGGDVTFSVYYRPQQSSSQQLIEIRRLPNNTAVATDYLWGMFNIAGLQLHQVIGGAGTTLVNPISGVTIPTGIYLCLELRCHASTLSMRVIRQDTGQFFVNTGSGSWSSTPQVISATTTAVQAAGNWAIQFNDATGVNYDDWIIDPAVPSIDIPTVSLGTGSIQQLTAGGFTDPLFGVAWTSSNTAVARVSGSGLVTATGTGTATITAIGKRDPSQTAAAAVTVTAPLLLPYRIPITIDNTANTTSALSYHQVSVALTGAAYTSFHAHAKADGSDVRVMDSDGLTPLSFVLEGIDTVNSAVYLIVKVPAVAAASTKTIYVCYGNAAVTSASSYANTIRPSTGFIGPNDIVVTGGSGYTFTDTCGCLLVLKNQAGAGGGGAGLNGRVLTFISNGSTGNGTGFPNLVKATSTDGGMTWTTAALIPNDGVHASVARSAIELADGTILLAFTYDTGANWALGKAFQYVARSHDGGVTWTNLPSPSSPMTVPWIYGTTFGAPHAAMVEKTPGGDIYMPNYGQAVATDVGYHFWVLKCVAGNDPTIGTNWVVQGFIFDNVNKYTETALIQTSDSSHYLAISRCANQPDLMYATSADSCVTWTAPVALGVPGSPANDQPISPSLLRLQSGNLLLNWGVRYGQNFGCLAALSTDGGATWFNRPPAIVEATPTAGVNGNNVGYSTAAQRADGAIIANGFHQVGGIATVYRVIFTEDYVCNSGNLYDGCEALGSLWTAGTNATLDATHVHGGAKAVKVDNSAATGGTGDYLVWVPLPGNTWSAQASSRIGLSFWSYESQNVSAWSVNCQSVPGQPGTIRTIVGVLSPSDHVEWHNGTAYQDTGVAAPQAQWNKITVTAAYLAASAPGRILVNDVVATTSLGQFGSGGPSLGFKWTGGSTSSTNNVTFWIDDVYTHQYTPNTPAVTAGSEQIVAGVAATLAPDTVTATAVALPPRTAAAPIALAPDTVVAAAVTFLPKLASAAITLAPDTVAAAALAVVPGAATAVGSFTLRADLVTCIAQPFVQTTSNYLLIDPEQTTRL